MAGLPTSQNGKRPTIQSLQEVFVYPSPFLVFSPTQNLVEHMSGCWSKRHNNGTSKLMVNILVGGWSGDQPR